jgi:hypothetical protein
MSGDARQRNEPTCSTCRYWWAYADQDPASAGGTGNCRRYAPRPTFLAELSSYGEQPGIFRQTAWPRTSEGDGCGEHEPHRKRADWC